MSQPEDNITSNGIAIIGMAGRFPGARNIDDYWQNLRSGVESVSFFSVAELEAVGIDPLLLRHPNYVRARAVLEDADLFDAAFFNFTPREAEITDPQHRLFLECAWETMENAGYDPERCEQSIGVFAGLSWNTYLLSNLIPNKDLLNSVGLLQASIQNRTDHLATKISYHLNLRGPSVTVQTACSTSLVAVHLACRSLLNYECDMVLAGGVSVNAPLKGGALYQEGSIISPDGHCRPFDAQAGGTIGGNGVGLVFLKRLDEALADRDFIYAVIKGSAVNNDGSLKAGYAAPGIDGQAQVIATAQAVAGILPDSVSYIEAHGTGTRLGDPIEVAALTQVFRASTDRKQFCALGSVKSNIGHLDTAAGIASLIKTVLALKNQAIPPSLHFAEPNPEIDFQQSPFYVNTRLSPWNTVGGAPRRAGVSSFGIGGTNVHLVVEEAPTQSSTVSVSDAATSRSLPSMATRSAMNAARSKADSSYHLLLLSARTPSALETATANLGRYLRGHQDLELKDVAFTLRVGRRAFARRRAVVCRDMSEAVSALETLDPRQVFTARQEATDERSLIFMFPGQGAQQLHMAAATYHDQPLFRTTIDYCAQLLKPELGCDLVAVLFPAEGETEWAAVQLQQTLVAQAALFTVEYALAQLWMQWGIRPNAMIGHSLGEYVAACLAGVFTLEEGLRLIAERGRLMQGLAAGAMLSVNLSEEQTRQRLTAGLSLAAVNGPALCVISGSADDVVQLEKQLTAEGVTSRRLPVERAFHSAMMDPIIESFTACIRKVRLRAPQIPYISSLTGRLITADQATDPAYWGQQLRQPVRFATGIEQFLGDEKWVFLEVGPGRTLMTLTRWHAAKAPGQIVLTSLPAASTDRSEQAHLLGTLGQLWGAGVGIQWDSFGNSYEGQRVPLPSYPFERQRYWIEPKNAAGDAAHERSGKLADLAEWFYVPSWKRVGPAALNGSESLPEHRRWLIFVDECGLGEKLKLHLEQQGSQVTTVSTGPNLERLSSSHYQINLRRPEEYRRLWQQLVTDGRRPEKIVHLWSVTEGGESDGRSVAELTGEQLEQSFYSLVYLAQALGEQVENEALQILVVSSEMQEVTGDERLCPEKATLLAACRVMPREYHEISCRSIDLKLAPRGSIQEAELVEQLLEECTSATAEPAIALRGGYRWVRSYEPVRIEETKETPRLREGGVYLITGGLGGIGLTLAEYLVSVVSCKLVLTGRSEFPEREQWSDAEGGKYGSEIRDKVARLRQLETAGGEVEVIKADVSDETQMRKVVERIREKYESLHGVIHAAGVPGGGIMQLRTHETSAEILAPKVQGTRVLEAVLKDFKLDFLVLCSSRTSILAGRGAVDYCAANLFLDAFAHYRTARLGGFNVSINWPGWREVGMLAAEHRKRLKDAGHRPQPQKIEHPLLDQLIVVSPDRFTFASQFSVASHWVLDEHRIFGHAVVPGVTYLEMARAALEQQSKGATVQLEDVYFFTPLLMRDDETSDVRLMLEGNGDGCDFTVMSRLISTNGDAKEWRKHAVGKIRNLPADPIRVHDIAAIIARCSARDDDEIEEKFRDENLGRRWPLIKKVYLGEREVLALLELSEAFADELETLQLHPAMLDRCAGFARAYLAPQAPWIPLSYKRVRVKGRLPRRVYAYVTSEADPSPEPQTLTYNVHILDENGVELVETEGFSHKRISDPMAGQRLFSRSAAVSVQAEAEDNQVVGDWDFVAEFDESPLGDGITPAEGAAVFGRILSSNLPPQVIVSPRDFQDVLRQVNSVRLEGVTRNLEAATPTRETYPRPEMPTPYVAPKEDFETRLARVWQEILGLDAVGIDDNFFELGGDSVLAIEIVAKAQEAGVPLRIQQLFQHPTIAELVARIGESDTVQSVVPAVNAETAWSGADDDPIRRTLAMEPELESVVRLSPLQQGILFDSLRNPTGGFYIEHLSFELHGALSVSAFVWAWQRMMDRHEMLRASFRWKNLDEPLQVVHRKLDAPLSIHDWSGLSATAQQDELEQLFEGIQRSGLELSHPPLLRVNLIHTAQDCHKLIWSYHHIILDGWSVNVLLSELCHFYQAARGGQDPQLDQNCTYQDYVGWLQAHDFAAANEFWRRTLSGFSVPTPLPGRHPAEPSANATREFGKRQITLSEDLTSSLNEFARRNRLTNYTLMLGFWALMLSHYSGEEEVVFGTVVSGRPTDLMGSEKIVGLLANALPVRIRVSAEALVIDWLQSLMAQHLEMQQFEYSPLLQVRGLSEVPGGQPLFESLLTYENFPHGNFPDEQSLGIEIKEPVRHATRTTYPLSLVLEPREGLVLNVAYDPRRFDDSTVTRILEDFEALCHRVVTQPDLRLGQLSAMLGDMDNARKVAELKKRTASRLERFKNVQLKPIDLTESKNDH